MTTNKTTITKAHTHIEDSADDHIHSEDGTMRPVYWQMIPLMCVVGGGGGTLADK